MSSKSQSTVFSSLWVMVVCLATHPSLTDGQRKPTEDVRAPSEKKIYLVSLTKAEDRRAAREMCLSHGGFLLNLEYPETELFLHMLHKVIDNSNPDDFHGNFYTSLRYFFDDVFLWDDECEFASNETIELVTSEETDFHTVVDKDSACFQIRLEDFAQLENGEFTGRWCNCSRPRKYICEIETSDPCDIEKHEDVRVTVVGSMMRQTFSGSLEECRRRCLETVTGEQECWYYGVDGPTCSMWTAEHQPIQHPFTADLGRDSNIYSKNCISLRVENALQRGSHSVPGDYEPCALEPAYDPTQGTGVDDSLVDPQPQSPGTVLTVDHDAIQPTPGEMDKSPKIETPPPLVTDVPIVTEPEKPKDPTDDIELAPTILETVKTTASIDTRSHHQVSLSTVTPTLSTPIVTPSIRAAVPDVGVSTVTPTLSTAIVTPSLREPAPVVGVHQTLKDASVVCRPTVNRTNEEKEQFTEELVANLSIDVKKTSAYVRKYECAEDDRPSATQIGGVGAVFLGLVFGGIVLSDMPALVKFIHGLFKKYQKRGKVVKIQIPSPKI